jgi:DNA polymerase-3 subunit epsilon
VLEPVPLAEVIVLCASDDELAAHEDTLNGLDKQVKGNCIWRATLAPAIPA